MRILEKIDKKYQEKKPFVAYRKPNTTVLNYMCQDTTNLVRFQSFEDTGFVFAPFDDDEQAYLILSDEVDAEEIKVENYTLPVDDDLPINTADEQKHRALIDKTIAAIKEKNASKIVISRKEELLLENFSMVEVFKKMLTTYKNAYVYVWYHPKVGLWMGATPETLLTVHQHNFETMSLAGTQPYQGTVEVNWGPKEIEEQQMVSDYIKSNLEKTVHEFSFSEVKTVRAGNLLHLKTKITGVLNSKKEIEVLVKLLHPTPAVCGLPKQKSKAFILKEESYSRSFYTGYLGEVNRKENTALYVNLRCFSFKNNIATLYVGGGITKDSNVMQEWLETVAKSKTIKRVLF